VHQGEAIRLLEAEPAPGTGPPGTVLDAAGLVACGQGALRLLRLQRPGRGPLPVGDFLRGFPLPAGTALG
jgi:methionyl-tRNA formyltransferase